MLVGAKVHRSRWVEGATVGLVAVAVGSQRLAGTGWSVSDVFVGLSIGIPGLLVLGRDRSDLVAWSLVAASLLWFGGTVAAASGVWGTIGAELRFAHRSALLVGLVAPVALEVRVRGWPWWPPMVGVATMLASLLVGFGPGAGAPGALAIVGGACLGVAVAGLVIGVVVARRTMWIAGLLATMLWIAAATASRWSSTLDPDTRLFGYRLGVAAAAVALAASRAVRRGVIDQIVDVGRRAGLGGALGDPRLRIGFEVQPGTFHAVDGSQVVPDRSQVISDVELGVEGRARIVHRPALLDDRRIRADVEAAVRLLAEQHRLTQDLTEASLRVEESRRRLIDAQKTAAAAFAVELDRRVVPHLDDIVNTLRTGAPTAGDPSTMAVSVRTELAELAAGIAPRGLREGLFTTLRSMAAEAPIAVELAFDDVAVGDDDARTLYFVAAEALSNAVKHSGATKLVIRLVADSDAVELVIEDDGVGEISQPPGGGLAGLSDRLAAAGGTLQACRTDDGAKVVARLPVSRCAPTRGWSRDPRSPPSRRDPSR